MKFTSKTSKETQDVIINKAKEWPELHIDEDFDDAGLTPVAARLYIHLWRLSKKVEVKWPGITAIAATIRTRRETVIHAIRELEERGFLQVKRAWGLTTEYLPLPKLQWIPVTQTHQSPKRTGAPKAPVTQSDRTGHPNAPVQNPPSPPRSLISGSPSPLESSSSPPLTPPTPLSTQVPPQGDFSLEAEPSKSKNNKRKPRDYEDLHDYVVIHLELEENDASWLWEKWKGNGCKVGGKLMEDWKMTASCWERMGYYPSQKKAAR